MSSRTISREQLEEAASRYWGNVIKLPAHLAKVMPGFKTFLAPDSFPYLYQRDWVKLSPLGVHRYQILHSPHVLTLLTIYALQRLEQSNE